MTGERGLKSYARVMVDFPHGARDTRWLPAIEKSLHLKVETLPVWGNRPKERRITVKPREARIVQTTGQLVNHATPVFVPSLFLTTRPNILQAQTFLDAH